MSNIITNGNNIKIDKIYSKKYKILGACPVCGKGNIIVGRTGYGCSRWKEGCKFFIGKTIVGKNITESIAKKLIKDRRTNIIKGFKSKTGKNFNAALKIENARVTFDFSVKNESLGACPVCKVGEIASNKSGYGCSRWKEGCKFFIGKQIAGKNITESIVKKLITGKSTEVIKGFKSKAGKSFDAVLILKDGKVNFDFQKL